METTGTNRDNAPILLTFGKSLRHYREKMNLTQEAIAYQAGFSRSYYNEVENGKRNISLINISKLTDVLNVSISELLNNI